ncbi:MAG: hypothetical protein EKE20_02575 [Candidatus Symbiopectobacterium sp. Dall1.0]|nr:hypothetical protein [Candidatus Symbiopectobacterium sp. Dall1.0]
MEKVFGAGADKHVPSDSNASDENKGNPRYNESGVENCNNGIIGGLIMGLWGGIVGVALGVTGGAVAGGCFNKVTNSNPSLPNRTY